MSPSQPCFWTTSTWPVVLVAVASFTLALSSSHAVAVGDSCRDALRQFRPYSLGRTISRTNGSWAVAVACAESYDGEAVNATCMNDTWTDLPICVYEGDCNDLLVSQAFNVTGSYTNTSGSTVLVSCIYGFSRPAKAVNVSCSNGTWMNLPNCLAEIDECEVECLSIGKVCSNTSGSFSCHCESGYASQDPVTQDCRRAADGGISKLQLAVVVGSSVGFGILVLGLVLLTVLHRRRGDIGQVFPKTATWTPHVAPTSDDKPSEAQDASPLPSIRNLLSCTRKQSLSLGQGWSGPPPRTRRAVDVQEDDYMSPASVFDEPSEPGPTPKEPGCDIADMRCLSPFNLGLRHLISDDGDSIRSRSHSGGMTPSSVHSARSLTTMTSFNSFSPQSGADGPDLPARPHAADSLPLRARLNPLAALHATESLPPRAPPPDLPLSHEDARCYAFSAHPSQTQRAATEHPDDVYSLMDESPGLATPHGMRPPCICLSPSGQADMPPSLTYGNAEDCPGCYGGTPSPGSPLGRLSRRKLALRESAAAEDECQRRRAAARADNNYERPGYLLASDDQEDTDGSIYSDVDSVLRSAGLSRHTSQVEIGETISHVDAGETLYETPSAYL